MAFLDPSSKTLRVTLGVSEPFEFFVEVVPFGVVSGGDDVSLEEVTRAGELVTKSLPPTTRIVWGARVEPNMRGSARVMVVLTGVESTFLSQQAQSRFQMGPIRVGSRN